MPVNWKKGKAELKDKKSSGSNTGESGDDVYLKDGWYRLKIYAEDLAGNRKGYGAGEECDTCIVDPLSIPCCHFKIHRCEAVRSGSSYDPVFITGMYL